LIPVQIATGFILADKFLMPYLLNNRWVTWSATVISYFRFRSVANVVCRSVWSLWLMTWKWLCRARCWTSYDKLTVTGTRVGVLAEVHREYFPSATSTHLLNHSRSSLLRCLHSLPVLYQVHYHLQHHYHSHSTSWREDWAPNPDGYAIVVVAIDN